MSSQTLNVTATYYRNMWIAYRMIQESALFSEQAMIPSQITTLMLEDGRQLHSLLKTLQSFSLH